MPTAARHAGKLFRRRYPDMFADAGGTVHPIRNSPGYDELEDRARTVSRHRAAQEEEARDEEREDPRGKLDEVREWEAIRRAIMPQGIGRGRQASGRYTYDREEIPEDLYRVDGMGPDVAGERLIPLLGKRAESMDGHDTLVYLRGSRRRYQAAVGAGGHHGARAAGRLYARRMKQRAS